MKRIAFISEHASPLAILGGVDNGGQNVYVAELARALAARGYEIDVYTRKDHHQQARVVDWQPGIRVIHIKAGPESIVEKEQLLIHMEEFRNDMIDFINRDRKQYDLIHAHFFMSALVASSLKKILHIPYTVTFHALGLVRKLHQQEADRFPPERCMIEQFVVHDADHIIAECPQDRKDLIRLYSADAKKITIVPCGFNPSEFQPYDRNAARQHLGLPQDKPILLQLGRMVPRKGIDTVIRALGCLLKAGEKARLVIVGGNDESDDTTLTPEIGRLKKIACDENVQDDILFTGRKSRHLLKYYYAAADIFITTPWYEPFGITPLEAMACGIPVVGSDTGGIKYSVANGRTGFLVPAKDFNTLAEKIGHLIKDPGLRLSMGRRGLHRVHSLFTWEKVADQMCSVYTGIETSLRRERLYSHRAFVHDRPYSRTISTPPLYPALYIP
ncbi:MAG: glycosyltransferase [Bacteroidetes bacterium]|nr:glycosyltransferase [Bacteroidota bacterium]